MRACAKSLSNVLSMNDLKEATGREHERPHGDMYTMDDLCHCIDTSMPPDYYTNVS